MILELRWFTARLLYESTSDKETKKLFEERLILLQADSGIEGAKKKAIRLGKATGGGYSSVGGQEITWSFRELLDLIELSEPEIQDGSEVYYHFLTEKEVDGVKESLQSGSIA
jgi:hypothetical protein